MGKGTAVTCVHISNHKNTQKGGTGRLGMGRGEGVDKEFCCHFHSPALLVSLHLIFVSVIYLGKNIDIEVVFMQKHFCTDMKV